MIPNARLLAALFLLGCAPQNNGAEPAAATSSAKLAPAPTAPTSTAPAAPASAAPSAAAPSASAPAASGSASAASAPDAPPPDVEVKNIGMHIGGGPNDAETKSPIKRSVEPHFEALARCFAKADAQDKGGDVSIDLKIDKAGGKAEIKKYKSGIDGEAFQACIREVFAEIEFLKPKTGTTVVSYSLRFTPKKK
ncbi:MAG: hypothetical protein JNL21_03420 [Myxococcales bacterium]|nr:hypothetical protein [Myxococcales bacterium]